MCGRIAKWLRIFGYDTVYITEHSRPQLVMRSLKENRTIITRDHTLSYKRAWKVILIDSDKLGDQLRQLAAERSIVISPSRFFTRCTICNCPIVPVANKEEVKGLVPEYIFATQDAFSKCSGCGKLYWAGTHRNLLLKDLAKQRLKVEPS